MTQRVCGLIGIGVLVAAVGCTSTPAAPASTSGGGGGASTATSTASIGAPRPLVPANGAQIKNADQPITLFAANAVTTSGTGTTYTFEIASDAAFNSKFQTKSDVAEGANGQTSVKLDTLPASSDYFWHVRATGGGTSGIFGSVFKFTIGPAIIINAPLPIAPLSGAGTLNTLRPALRVTNAIRQGPVGAIAYKFEIATSSAFAPSIVTGTSTEGVNETGFIPTTDLPSNVTLFWRATATDSVSGISSAPSAVQSFSVNQPPSQADLVAAKLGVVLWPGVKPPGTSGHAVMGTDWTVEPIKSFDGVTFINPPLDELQIFDLIDRGMSPPDAVDWMHANGYATVGVWYPDVQVLAFPFEYIALINGRWDIVIRVGA